MPRINKALRIEKVILILAGIAIFFILLEFGLRLMGFVLVSMQEQRNINSLKANGQCSIMCIGESTTALGGGDSYPAQLEKILNERHPGLKISVINKGIPAADSSFILRQLEENMGKYKHDIVVAMIGVNDFNNNLCRIKSSFFVRLKTYKMLKLIWLTLTEKLSYGFGVKGLSRKENNKWFGNFSEDSLKKCIELDPANDNAYLQLANFYVYGDREREAKPLFKKATELNPNNDYAYAGLGWCYRREGYFVMAEGLFKKALELNPKNEQACIELGQYYYKHGSLDKSEELFKRAIYYSPANYIDVGSFYMSQNDFVKAEEVFNRVVSADSDDNRAYGALALICQMTGRLADARQYYDKSRRLQLIYTNSLTSSNYNKIKEILDKNKIKLVCVQYPMRNIKPLEDMFIDQNGIIFVDNEKIFRDAIQKEEIKEYFWDMFAGDFGHCTARGNKLLAQNIANALDKTGIFYRTTINYPN